MKLDITAPEEVVGEITGYLQMRRCIITGIDNVANSKVLRCKVPLAEMFGFSTALPKLSGGRASFSMEPFGYQEISQEDLQRMGDNNTISF
jgi:elongation factor G